MLCLVFAHSRLYVATIIFYTCVWIPFLQIKQALLSIIGLVFGHHQHQLELDADHHHHQQQQQQQLPVVRLYEELVNYCANSTTGDLCSVCIGELGRQDELIQLTGCGHIFHHGCIRSWVDRNQFTCPLCRSLIS